MTAVPTLPLLGFQCENSHASRLLEYIVQKISDGSAAVSEASLATPDFILASSPVGRLQHHLLSCNEDEIVTRHVKVLHC